MLDVNENVTSLILQNAPLSSYRALIDRNYYGLISLNAKARLVAGQTTLSEISVL